MLAPAVGWYDWLLFIHVAGAFALVAAMVVYWALVVESWRDDPADQGPLAAALMRPAAVLVAAGLLLTLVFGIWLAIYLDGYELWDGWILGTLVLWAIAAETGRRTGKAYAAVRDRARELAADGDAPSPELRAMFRTRTGLLFQTVTTIALVAALALMIWKPGGV